MIFDLWPHPKVTSLTLGWKFTCILFCSSSPSIWYTTWPCLKKKIFWPLGLPQHPKVPPLGHDPGDRMKIPSDMFCIFSFVSTHTKFGIKIFEIDFVIEIKWYLTFWPLPRAPGGGTKKKFDVARPIHVSNSHTKFGWISSNGLGGDSITDRQTDGRTDGRRRLQYPLRFFKKAWG